jgi:putative ABC transport system ATP-binding protein
MALIEIKNLKKRYDEGESATTALHSVSFNVEKGEFVAIMGPSGSGKSTLLHILGFLDQQTSGTYHFDGKQMRDYTGEEAARVRNKEMGFIFQAFNLLPRTSVYDNVLLPLVYSDIPESEWDGIVKKAIKSVGLENRASHEPSELSGGEKQRAAIARALVVDPQIIFADEPTGNLDSKSGQVIMEILQDLNERDGRTIVLITHETYTAENAARILHMKDGEIEKDEAVAHRKSAKQKYIK